MKNITSLIIRPTLRGLVLALAALALTSYVASAHPYASGITNVSGNINYYLNENATDVQVVFDNGTSATNDLGALLKGPQSFSLGAHTNYSIIVYNTGAGTWTQTSTTASNSVNFYGPRGVAVNPNPKTGNFGRIYVSNSGPGTSGGRTVGRGLYAMNADQSDALGYGNTAKLPGSMTIGGNTTYGLYHLTVGPDDMVYAGDGSGTYYTTAPIGYSVWMVNPDFSGSTQLFPQANGVNSVPGAIGGVVCRPVASGSLANNNLVLTLFSIDYNPVGPGYCNLIQCNIGGSANVPWSGTPSILAYVGVTNGISLIHGVLMDVDIDPVSGNIFALQETGGTGVPSDPAIRVLNPSGTLTLWDSYHNGGLGSPDYFNFQYSIGVSPDGRFMAAIITSELVAVLPLVNGIPDYTDTTGLPIYLPNVNPITPSGHSGTARGIAWDAADNIYTVSGGSDQMRVFSLGMTTTCITYNDQTGTNGTFTMTLPATTVSVTAPTPNASQNFGSPTPGVFTIARTGQTTGPLTVNFTLGGTATAGVYTVTSPAGITPAAANTVTIAAGQSSTNITITPTTTPIARLTTSVILTVNGGTGYGAGSPNPATVLIQNTTEPQLWLSAAAPTAYKRFTNDYASVTITRLGNTNVALTLSTFTYGGTAVQNTDYALLSSTTIPAGTITTTANIFSPLNPPEPSWVGDKTVVVTLGNNGGTYTAAPGAASQTLTILDDKYPPAPVLWSDPLTTVLGGENGNDDGYGQWNLTWVARDNVTGLDATIDWGYDLVNDPNGYGPIPLPPNGLNNALRVTYNKVHGISGAVNLYPTNVTFSGDYALRFQMYISEGGENGAVGRGVVTEGPMFGINHAGTNINWWAGSTPTGGGGPWLSDGVWYWLDADPGGATFGDYVELTGIANSYDPAVNTGWAKLAVQTYPTFANVFKDPQVFTTVGATTNAISGMPANASWAVVPTNNANWSDVEIKQVKNVVTLSIDKTVVFTYVNTNSLFQQGTPMLGYEDPFDSLNDPDAAVFYSNLQVVRLGSPTITGISAASGNVTIQFVTTDGDDTTSAFALQSCGTVNGTYTDVSPAATFTQDPTTGIFTTVYPQNGNAQFYRIRQCSSCGD